MTKSKRGGKRKGASMTRRFTGDFPEGLIASLLAILGGWLAGLLVATSILRLIELLRWLA